MWTHTIGRSRKQNTFLNDTDAELLYAWAMHMLVVVVLPAAFVSSVRHTRFHRFRARRFRRDNSNN